MAKKNYYCVRVGKTPGIYKTWDECKAMVDGVSGAKYKGFSDYEDALEYMEGVEFSENNQVEISSNAEELNNNEAVAYVDGSYDNLTGDYSCGIVYFTKDEMEEISMKGEDSELAEMRNVAGEIMGAEIAMKKAVESGLDKLTIYYDYKGIEEWCLGRWKTNKAGTIAYKQFYDSVKDRLNVKFVKVKGHSGDKYNDVADKLAKQALGII